MTGPRDYPMFQPYAVFKLWDYWQVRDGAGRIRGTFRLKREALKLRRELKRRETGR